MQKSRPVALALVIIIIIVYIMTFANFSLNWLTVRSALVGNGENILTQVTRIEKSETAVIMATGIMAALSTLLVDSIMVRLISIHWHRHFSRIFKIWRCWLVWGQRWQIVLLPSLCLAAGIGTVIHSAHHFLSLNE